MIGKYQVDAERVRAAAADIARTSNAIEEQAQAMMNKLNGLQGAWDGAAAQRFSGVVAEWRRTQSTLHQSLEHIGQLVTRASEQYESTEQANAALFHA